MSGLTRASGSDVRQATDRCHRPWDYPQMQFGSVRWASRSIPGFSATLLLTFALASFSMPSRAIEEPDYRVVREFAGIEVRQYGAYTVAEVVVPGPAAEAGNEAFRILAGYIFGKNKGERKFAMTAPVTQAAVPKKLQFVLPKDVTVASAPEPLDARVQIREVPPSLVAVIRYSGFWSESNYNDHLAKLQEALRGADLPWTGEPVYSRYNAPFTPWFMRRNEIWLHLTGRP